MNKSKQHLSTLLNTVTKTQVSIHSVLRIAIRTDLRQLLREQLCELDCVASQAYSIAATRGWELKEADIMKLLAAKLMTTVRLFLGRTDTKIVAMMLCRSAQDMICFLQELRCTMQTDQQINALNQQLADCAAANIRQMQGFL